MEPKDRIIVPLDVDEIGKAIELAKQLRPHVGGFKIGLELIYRMLASVILPSEIIDATRNLRQIRELFSAISGKDFLDSKLDDIPNTVRGASIAISTLGVSMFNVHASAGRAAVEQAVANKGDSFVLGVTVLTSIDEDECISIFGAEPGEKVLQFAEMLLDVRADGIICSAQELALLQEARIPADLLRVTPGIRPEWAVTGDQKRIMTPAEAVRLDADYLVIGRPIRTPPEKLGGPVFAAKLIADEIAKALKGEK